MQILSRMEKDDDGNLNLVQFFLFAQNAFLTILEKKIHFLKNCKAWKWRQCFRCVEQANKVEEESLIISMTLVLFCLFQTLFILPLTLFIKTIFPRLVFASNIHALMSMETC